MQKRVTPVKHSTMSSGEDKIRLKIKELETEYARTQKNKATEGHLGLLKAKLSKLRRELLGEYYDSTLLL